MVNGDASYARYVSGDDSALGELISEYKDGLILFLNNYVRNIITAEELCEDTFVKLAVKKPHFKGNSSFKTFLYTIARNIAIDYLRKSKNTVPMEDLVELQDKSNLEREYLKEEQRLNLHSAMKKLKPDYSRVLWLIYFEELSNKEAAAVMGKSAHAIETMVYRARMALKTQLEKEGFIYENI